MSRYTHTASWYDSLSAEPIYRVGRERAIPALHLQAGSRVLDIGCGTGLNFPSLLAAVGRSGQVVGVDRNREMLEVARRKMTHAPPGDVVLVEADAEQLDADDVGLNGLGAPFDAVLFTYSLSLMRSWEQAWRRATALVRPGGRAAIVDMGLPHGWARLLDPAARLACRLGGGGYQRTSVDGAGASCTRRAVLELARRARPGAGRDAVTPSHRERVRQRLPTFGARSVWPGARP